MKTKPVKGKKSRKPVKAKKPPKPLSLKRIIYNSIAETLQANSDGEFDLPSILTKYNEKSHPKYKLGLHREFYTPAESRIPFYSPNSEKAFTLFQNQASIILGAFDEGIIVKDKKFKPPLCESCKS